ncbi:SPOCS domain-containing protein [Eubacterium sp.]|uniref:DUF3794 and LysM peptidoglycan-binding domain-containing protein n=1 Tax=Eubacterium sp. TaxID=142586 RepID=UPI003521DAD0
MELIKSNIHMSKILKNEAKTFYVNHEERITEAYPEVGTIINQSETATVDNVSVRNNQIVINGTINYQMLYYGADDGRVNGLEGEIPFEEVVKAQDIDEDGNANVKLMVMSSSVKMIDNRSYIYKIQIMAYVTVEKLEDVEAVTGADRENMMTKYGHIDGISIVADKSDNLRIHEQLSVPSSKPPIERILWKDVRIKNINEKMTDSAVLVTGELGVFLLYSPEEESAPIQWIDTTVNFGGTLEINEAGEDLISYITSKLHNITVDAEMNQDNEMREININALLKMNIKIYEEKPVDVLEDVYAPEINLVPIKTEQVCERLLVKNAARTKNVVKIKVDSDKGHILQICGNSADIKIENIVVSDNGLKAIGKIKAWVMYISSEDSNPICCKSAEMDFEHRIDAEGITNDDKYYVNWWAEQISGNMTGTDEVEIKLTVAMEVMAFREERKALITEIKEESIDLEKVNAAPLMRGYVVQSGDTLWKLAKENFTTIDKIMEVNELKTDHIKKGDRLLLIKSCQ